MIHSPCGVHRPINIPQINFIKTPKIEYDEIVQHHVE